MSLSGEALNADVLNRLVSGYRPHPGVPDELLQADGRQSYATMAKEVSLSEAAVRQRVQRLREAGVIQIVAVTDPMQVGFRRQAMVGIKASGDLAMQMVPPISGCPRQPGPS